VLRVAENDSQVNPRRFERKIKYDFERLWDFEPKKKGPPEGSPFP